ncbi:transposase [Deinococcus enclensis]|uniref:Transposase IS4-like domain-containing protein n=1 Tax=Deinococcus enclensis TaxID=1049582 RepID=A0ABT9MHQ4_9DEIO|nr:transposase [Deinococcus enclensis]MDP9766101.1 hypothetical protein [Deinococcus enclensis]
MNPKEVRARRLYSDILTCFTRKQHLDSFQVFLDLLLEAKGRPLPVQATVKSPAALSRFLNHYGWSTRSVVRAMRQHAQQTLLEFWQHAPHQRPRLELLIDLTSLEKTGKFEELTDWMHVYNGVHGVHLVVLYLCCGPLRLPWAFQVWRGRDTPSPALLALQLLRTVPNQLLNSGRQARVHADGGFDSADFIHGVLDLGLDLIVGVRKNRKLADGRKVEDLTVRGSMVQLQGLRQPVCISWVWLYRNEEPEQRFVMSNRRMGGVHLARVGKRRWKIEGFFKTIKGRFGLSRFAQHSKQGVLRWWCLSGLAFLLCHLQDLDVPTRPPGRWPDWGELAHHLRVMLVFEVRRAALLLELDALDAAQRALFAPSS